MKKTFVNPEMNISLFAMENVVTDSLSTTTNVDTATAALEGSNITTLKASEINWAF